MSPSRGPKPTATSMAAGAVLYLRVSDEKQAATDTDGGYSIPVQRRDCQGAADNVGAAFTEVFEEPGRSGTVRKRPALSAALERAKDPDIRWFVVHKASRLARNARDALNIEFELAQSGVQLVAATEAWDESPMGKLMKLLQFGFDQAYSERLSDDVRHKMEEKVRRGGTPHVAPQGYLNVRKNIDGVANVARIDVDPDRGDHLTWAFKAFATGDYTVNTLLEALTDRGFTSRPTKKYPARPISQTRLATLLRNPYYIGIVTWGGQQYPGAHDPLIDVATFEKVQQVLDANNTGGDKTWKHKQYLIGTLRCGHCKTRMGFTHGRGNGGQYEYFYCRSKHGTERCEQRYVPVFEIEAAVERYYSVVQEKARERLPRLKEAFSALLGAHRQEVDAESRRQIARIADLKRQQHKLLQLSYDDGLPDAVVRDEVHRIAKQIDHAEAALVATKVNIGDLKTRFEQLCQILENPETVYRTAIDADRRVMNQFWFDWIDIFDTEAIGHVLSEMPAFALDAQTTQRMEADAVRIKRGYEDEQWDKLVDELKKEEPDASLASGSIVSCLVAGAGFEPATFGL